MPFLSPMLSLFPPVHSDYFIPQATAIESDISPWPKKRQIVEKHFFFLGKLETSMEQYRFRMQKPKNKAEQRRDVQVDKQKIQEKEQGREGLKEGRREREKKGEREGERKRLGGIIWTSGSSYPKVYTILGVRDLEPINSLCTLAKFSWASTICSSNC